MGYLQEIWMCPFCIFATSWFQLCCASIVSLKVNNYRQSLQYNVFVPEYVSHRVKS